MKNLLIKVDFFTKFDKIGKSFVKCFTNDLRYDILKVGMITNL